MGQNKQPEPENKPSLKFRIKLASKRYLDEQLELIFFGINLLKIAGAFIWHVVKYFGPWIALIILIIWFMM